MDLTRSGGPGERPPIDPEQQRQLDLQRELERQKEQELQRPVIAVQLEAHIDQRPDLQNYLRQFKPEEQDKLKQAMTDSIARFGACAKQINHVQIGKQDGKLYVLSSKYFMGIADPAQTLGISEQERYDLSRPKQQESIAGQPTALTRTPEREQTADNRQQHLQHPEPAERESGQRRLESGQMPQDMTPQQGPHLTQRLNEISQQIERHLGDQLKHYSPEQQQALTQALSKEVSDFAGWDPQIKQIRSDENGLLHVRYNKTGEITLDPQQVLQPERDIARPQATLTETEQLRQDTQRQLAQQIEQLTQFNPMERMVMESRLREAVGDESIKSLRMEGEDTFHLDMNNGMVLTATSYELLNMESGRELLQRAPVGQLAQNGRSAEAGNLLIDPSLKELTLSEPIAVLAQSRQYGGLLSLTTFEAAKKGVSLNEATARGEGFRNITGPAIISGLTPSAIGLIGSASVPLGIGGSTVVTKSGVALQGSQVANVTVQTLGKHLGKASLKTRLTGAGIGMGVNTSAQLATREKGEKLDHGSIVLSGLTGGLSTGASLWGTVAVNSGGTFTYQKIKGEEAGSATAATVVGSILGYGIGSKVVEKSLNPVFNPVRNQYQFVPVHGTNYMYSSVSTSSVPGIAGNITGSISSEYATQKLQQRLGGQDKNE